MVHPAPLPWETLAALGPPKLVSYRRDRFRGDALSIQLAAFAPEDRAILRRCYDALHTLLGLLDDVLQAEAVPAGALDRLVGLVRQLEWRGLVREMQRFGAASLARANTPLLATAIHDLRGGSFVALIVGLDLLQLSDAALPEWQRIFFLARDHLKIMRNVVPDLDPARWEQDMLPMAHSIRLLLEKWHRARHLLADGSAEVLINCRFGGDVADRCMEFAALDRVLYNLINNAARYAADRVVHLAIFPLNARDVRFVVTNRMPVDQRVLLGERFGDTLDELFAGGFTVGGSGLGMRICAEFIAADYGLASPQEAVAGGYIGARQIDDLFVVWFHWPIAAGA